MKSFFRTAKQFLPITSILLRSVARRPQSLVGALGAYEQRLQKHEFVKRRALGFVSTTPARAAETHHREIVPKIMRAVERHGGKRIALGHGEQLRVHLGEPPSANRLVVHEFPSLEAVEAWVEDVKANREQLHTLGDLTIISVPAI